MKGRYEYQCDNCEDTEWWDEILKSGSHCECDGHLHLVKRDRFVSDGIPTSICDHCVNKTKDDVCADCKHRKESK